MRAKLAMLLGVAISLSSASAFDTRGPVATDGTPATVDLPASLHIRNVGGSDGAGLCVFTSIQHASLWQNITELSGFRDWMQSRPGGGWPEKVDAMLASFCKSKGVVLPSYIQHTGGEEAFLLLTLKTGRIPCVTYDGRDGFYRGAVGHMVNLAYLDNNEAAIIDNNRPGFWVWMTREEFLSRWRGSGGGWAITFLAPSPPPTKAQLLLEASAACNCQGPPCKCEKCNCASVEAKGLPPCYHDGEKPCLCWCQKCQENRGTVFGQCANGVCRVPVASQPVQKSGWQATTEPDAWNLWQNGVFKGTWYPDGFHEAKDAQTVFAEASQLPEGAEAPKEILTGVVLPRVARGISYTHKGNTVSKEDVFSVLTLSDDSTNWHVSFVGDAAGRAKAKAEYDGLDASIRSKLSFQAYDASSWVVDARKLASGLSIRKAGIDLGTGDSILIILRLPGGPLYVAPVPEPVAPVTPVQSPSTLKIVLGALAFLVAIYLRSRSK